MSIPDKHIPACKFDSPFSNYEMDSPWIWMMGSFSSVSNFLMIECVLGYVDSGSPTVGSSRSWKSMEMEIQSLLEKLVDINDAMSRCAASAAPTTSVTQKLARHRDILHECTQVSSCST